METRNLIKFGKNSYVVTIPSSWIKQNKLEKGDSVFVDNVSNSLLISSKSYEKLEENKIVIEIDKKNNSTVFREIVNAYINNYKIIEVRGNELKERSDIISNFLQGFMSLEIIEQTADKIVFQDFLNFQDISIPTITKRIDNIIRVMLEDCINSIDDNFSESMSQRDKSINRLYYLLFRMIRAALKNPSIMNMMGMNSLSLVDNWAITRNLETLGDDCKRITRVLQTNSVKKERTKIMSSLRSINVLYRESMKSYYDKNVKLADKLSDDAKNLLNDLDYFSRESKDKDVIYVGFLLKYFVLTIRSILRVVMRMN